MGKGLSREGSRRSGEELEWVGGWGLHYSIPLGHWRLPHLGIGTKTGNWLAQRSRNLMADCRICRGQEQGET